MIASEFRGKMFLIFFSFDLNAKNLDALNELFASRWQFIPDKRETKYSKICVCQPAKSGKSHFWDSPGKIVNLINKANRTRIWENQIKVARDSLCMFVANFKNRIGCLQPWTIYLCKRCLPIPLPDSEGEMRG